VFLTIHGPAAILISEHTNSIFLAFILSLLSHFALDFLPHENYKLNNWGKKGNQIKKYFFLALADFSLLAVITAILFLTTSFPNPYIIFAGLLGAVIPDILWGVYKVTKWKFLEGYYNFHAGMHNIWKDNLEPYQSNLIQIALLALFIFLILKL